MERRRVATSLGVAVAAITVPLATALPAQATVAQCKDYLAGAGYIVGPQVTRACETGSAGSFMWPRCMGMLQSIEVSSGHADAACTLAYA